MNILISAIILFIMTLCTPRFGTTVIYKFDANAISDDSGLKINDEIVEIDGVNVSTARELSYEIMRKGYEPISITVIRDGNKITLDNVVFPQISSDGIVFGSIDFLVYGEDRTFSTIIKNSYYSSKSTIKMIWDSLYDLITGRYGMEQVSGPIGVTGAITNAAKTSTYSLFYLVVVISMNLGIFNLLPIPALDGGSLLLIIIEMIIRRPIPQKIDYGIKAIGFLLLMGFAVLVTFKDIIFLFR